MQNQVHYYNQFGKLYEQNILNCSEPEYWTTDYEEKGRVYREMKERVAQQLHFINIYFKKEFPVLDIGCGFGRQAVLLAKNGYRVTGTDTSDIFIGIAEKLFEKNNYTGHFFCTDILSSGLPDTPYHQIILFDVLEHIPVRRRKLFLQKLHAISVTGAILILSLPHVRKRLSSRLNNRIRRRIFQHFPFFLKNEEHPYPVPEKKEMIKLTSAMFDLIEWKESDETDYYVFRYKPGR